jgi:hypothetical protein
MTEEKERPEPSPDEDQSESPVKEPPTEEPPVEEPPPRNRGKSEAASFSPPGATLLGDTSSPNLLTPFESWAKESFEIATKIAYQRCLSILRR